MDDNLALNLISTAEAHPEQPAIRHDGGVIAYATLAEWSARAAEMLRRQGLVDGDRVALMLPNVPEFAAALYGAFRAGVVAVPMNVLLKRREVAYQLRDSGARFILAWHGFVDEAEAGAQQAGVGCVTVHPEEFARLPDASSPDLAVVTRSGDDTAVLLYTSGTTGVPKGAELSHFNLVRNAQVFGRMLDFTPQDVLFSALPLFHAFGQTCGLHASIVSGSCVTLMPRFDPGLVLEGIEQKRATVFLGVPTMYAALASHPRRAEFDVSSLRLCVSGGAALPVEVLRAFEAEFRCVILEGYGLSETSPVASFNHPRRVRKPGSIGTPIEGVEMRLADDLGGEVPAGEVGEIVIRGHNVMKGYWHLPDATAEAFTPDGWFRSGDLARIDDDGYFFIVDRKKDVIIRGGFNVYPREVEEVIYEHPAVKECAVIPVPHRELGEEVGAAVVLKPGGAATAGEIREFVKERIAAFKYPRHVWFLAELPKGASGKILKREIEIPAAARQPASPAGGSGR